MGMAKRTRISQRMPQHIMLLKLALHITSSAVKSYQIDMFIAQRKPLVNTFLSVEALAGFLPQPVCRRCRIFPIFRARVNKPRTPLWRIVSRKRRTITGRRLPFFLFAAFRYPQ